jgi:hypothetical protein
MLIPILLSLLAAPYANGSLTPPPPKDRPVRASAERAARLRAAIAPLIDSARATWPAVRERLRDRKSLGGILFVSTELTDEFGNTEMVFLRVESVQDSLIFGRIANEIRTVRGYREGMTHFVPQSNLMDWTISRPDGTEEGNRIGKMIDNWKD